MKGIYIITLSVGMILLNLKSYSNNSEPIKPMNSIDVVLPDTTNGNNANVPAIDDTLDTLFEADLDSLVNTMYLQNVFVADSNEVKFVDYSKELLPDSTYVQQLENIESAVDLSFNNVVKNFIQFYTIKRRDQVEVMLGLSAHYFPMFEEALDRYELPLELKFIPIIESALNPMARSRVGASGMWQFMYSTAKLMNLEISSFIDERRDPLKSTDAAARYLKQLYDIYQDWQLVIAAYNCGPGTLNRAIKRAGGKKNYWEIYYNLPRETRQYVPAFIAATYVMNYFSNLRLIPQIPNIPVVTDTIMVNHLLHFNQIAANTGIDIEQIRLLNPMYRRDVIPGKPDKPYELRLPIEKVSLFVSMEDSIYNYDRDKYFPNNTLVEPSGSSNTSYTLSDIKGKSKIIYTVKSGDNVAQISQKFKVKAADLRSWNNIRNFIKAGQKLVVYVPETQKNKTDSDSIPTIKQHKSKASNQEIASAASQSGAGSADFVYYTVKKGDNFWTIAQKYPGVSNTDIMKLNSIRDEGSLKIGQKLKIKPKA
jgi:membrane-bound lytic murein transglycosylase D